MVGALKAQEPDVQFASGLSDSLEAQLRSVAARVPEFGGRLSAPMEPNLPKVGVEGSDPFARSSFP